MKRNYKQEHDKIQRQFVEYLQEQYPNVVFFSTAAGVYMGSSNESDKGKKFGFIKKLKALGVIQKGQPDILILQSMGGFNALAIEFKLDNEKLELKNGNPATPHIAEQIEYGEKLRNNGTLYKMCKGFDNARMILDRYMRLYKTVLDTEDSDLPF